MSEFTRKDFLAGAAVGGAAIALGGPAVATASHRRFGSLVRDPNGLLDLPSGFRYRVLQDLDDRLSNGARVPGDFDAMVALPGRRRGETVLVRNHELGTRDTGKDPVPQDRPYDGAAPGGTTAIVVGPDLRVRDSYVTSSGSLNNCAGGRTPWGTWITCEEDRTNRHGYCFEVDPSSPEDQRSASPIRAMGFFSHEAIAFDPRTGIGYLTEDDFRGQIADDPAQDTRASFLYRFVPNNRSPRPGALQDGGRLEALRIDESSPDADFFERRQRFGVRWVEVDAAEPHADALAKGCVRFNRLEGAFYDRGAIWFDDTAGGEERLGQLYRYIPSRNRLELFYEGTSTKTMQSPDNICVTPWGDLWFVEDGDGVQRIMGVTPEGGVYRFGANRLLGKDAGEEDASELCGPTFSPDGRTFFVNVQDPGHTFAITGPFPRRGSARASLATAAPPASMAPSVSPQLAEAARRHGMSQLEAAAFERLGAVLA